ncbi:hypothetical protein B0H14DRAFT_2595654 [Mycena olivaceomarginata]|nr:hypothetical protein B0H14DRAFT_2595654 [Mycena olivaceomarginata]
MTRGLTDDWSQEREDSQKDRNHCSWYQRSKTGRPMVMGSPQIKANRPAGAQGALGIGYPYGMSEKSQSACNGMVQHVTLGWLWSASKVWWRDLDPVLSRLKALCEFQAIPSRHKLWSPCEKPLAGLHQGPGPRTLAHGDKGGYTFCYFPGIISEGVRTIDMAWKWLEDSGLCVGGQLKPFGHAMAWNTFNANQSRIGFFRQTQFPVDPGLHLRKIFHSTAIADGGKHSKYHCPKSSRKRKRKM